MLGYTYAYFGRVDILPGFRLEIVVLGIMAFLWAYGFTIVYVSRKIPKALFHLRPALDYSNDRFEEFRRNRLRLFFNPSEKLLVALILLTVAEQTILWVNLPVNDPIMFMLIFVILVIANSLNWIGAWLLYSFLTTSSKFGKSIRLRINPFHPDRVGGLLPIADLSTLASFVLSILAALSIPLWYLISIAVSIGIVVLVSLVIPCFFLYSMEGIYRSLKTNKVETLENMSDELYAMSVQLQSYLTARHEKELSSKKLIQLSNEYSALQKIYESISKMRTFPINTGMVLKLISTMLVPVISLVVTRIVDLLWEIIVL